MKTTIATLLVLLVIASSAYCENFRTWTSVNGSSEFKAKMVSRNDTSVTLEREDGQRAAVPFEKLSRFDLIYLLRSAEPIRVEAATTEEKAVTTEGDATTTKIAVNFPEMDKLVDSIKVSIENRHKEDNVDGMTPAERRKWSESFRSELAKAPPQPFYSETTVKDERGGLLIVEASKGHVKFYPQHPIKLDALPNLTNDGWKKGNNVMRVETIVVGRCEATLDWSAYEGIQRTVGTIANVHGIPIYVLLEYTDYDATKAVKVVAP